MSDELNGRKLPTRISEDVYFLRFRARLRPGSTMDDLYYSHEQRLFFELYERQIGDPLKNYNK
jgi:hypothetical protein